VKDLMLWGALFLMFWLIKKYNIKARDPRAQPWGLLAFLIIVLAAMASCLIPKTN